MISFSTQYHHPFRIFYVYAHKDEGQRDRLAIALATLKQQRLIQEWCYRDIRGGNEWKEEITKHLKAADIILLLISPAFIASDYCSIELNQALILHEKGTARVIPIIISPVNWQQNSQLEKLQALPKNGKPVSSWTNKDHAWVNIENGIKGVIEELQLRQLLLQPISPQYALLYEDEKTKEEKLFPLFFDKEMSIGRDEGACMPFPDIASMSRLHCRIHWRLDGVYVTDLESRNKTLVNEIEIDSIVPTKLNIGDQLHCGKKTMFCLVDCNSTPPDTPSDTLLEENETKS